MTPTPTPPGPRGHVFIGNLLEVNRDPLGFVTRCAREYGDVVYLHVLNIPVYLLSHPDHIEDVLVTNSRHFIKDKGLRTGPARRLFGNGLLTSEGDLWIRQRRLAQPAFHRERIAAYGEVMVTYTEQMLAAWQPGETRNIHQDMMRLTQQIVLKSLYDVDAPLEVDEVNDMLEAVAEPFSVQGNTLSKFLDAIFPTPNHLRFQRAVRRLDAIVYQIIRQRRSHGRGTRDLLSMLLDAGDEDGRQISDQRLRDEVMTVFLAGHETTALALSWTWYLLSQYPSVENKLVSELGDVLGGRTPTVTDLARLRYTEAIVRESMRLYPPAWTIGREAVERCVIGGYDVPAGAQVIMSQWVVHRDVRWFDRPDEFNPDRWATDLHRQLPRYAYFPFGGGPRICIGNSFAMMEAVLILATVAQRVRLTLVPGPPVTPMPSITLRPKGGVQVTVSKR